MSDVLIFSVGSVFFVATTWATMSFGLARVHELRRQELAESGVVVEPTEGGYTDIYKSAEPDSNPSA